MTVYGAYALSHPHEIRFVAVAEPNEEKRKKFAARHGIPEDMQFAAWEDLLARPKLCQALMICTVDAEHYEPAMRAMDRGYDVLLEKPMSPNPRETFRMAEQSRRTGSMLMICHVLRYTPFFETLKSWVSGGKIGRLVTVQWNENVAYWHQAHSFVRGNWRNAASSSPMILAKCCHDMDLLQWLADSPCESVSSFGGLAYFTEQNAPAGSTERCTDGCAVESECPYSALKWYYNEWDKWPQNVVTVEPNLEARKAALETGPYGRCVFRCDNDVVDHQVVNMKFRNGVTVAFTMSAFSSENTRTFKLMGTEGEILGHLDKNELEIRYFNGAREVYYPQQVSGGHGGGDTKLMQRFIRLLADNDRDEAYRQTEASMQSHMIAFAAEASRRSGETVHMDAFVNANVR